MQVVVVKLKSTTVKAIHVKMEVNAIRIQDFIIAHVHQTSKVKTHFATLVQTKLNFLKGINCEVPFNPCFINPCRNFGRCIVKYGLPTCQCTSPYYGNRCQFLMDPCQRRPCQNSGICNSVWESIRSFIVLF